MFKAELSSALSATLAFPPALRKGLPGFRETDGTVNPVLLHSAEDQASIKTKLRREVGT